MTHLHLDGHADLAAHVKVVDLHAIPHCNPHARVEALHAVGQMSCEVACWAFDQTEYPTEYPPEYPPECQAEIDMNGMLSSTWQFGQSLAWSG